MFFSELPNSVVKDFDQLQAALLLAYELSPEHYRKKFRDVRKQESENFTDFAFKMQNYFKHWLHSVESYDNICHRQATSNFSHGTVSTNRLFRPKNTACRSEAKNCR